MCFCNELRNGEVLDFVSTDKHRVSWYLAGRGAIDVRTGRPWSSIYRKIVVNSEQGRNGEVSIGNDIFVGNFDKAGELSTIDVMRFEPAVCPIDIGVQDD